MHLDTTCTTWLTEVVVERCVCGGGGGGEGHDSLGSA